MPTRYPDITPAQIVAAIGSILGLLVDGQFVSGRVEHLVVGLASIVVPFGVVIADAIIRHGRSRALAPHAVVETVKPTIPPAA